MINRLYVDNYKCLVNFDLKLVELSLLLGPNGVGKSSVLDMVFALRQPAPLSLQAACDEYGKRLAHLGG